MSRKGTSGLIRLKDPASDEAVISSPYPSDYVQLDKTIGVNGKLQHLRFVHQFVPSIEHMFILSEYVPDTMKIHIIDSFLGSRNTTPIMTIAKKSIDKD